MDVYVETGVGTYREGAAVAWTFEPAYWGLVGQGPDTATAIGRAYDAVAHVDFAGMQVRSDIGRTVEPALAGIVS